MGLQGIKMNSLITHVEDLRACGDDSKCEETRGVPRWTSSGTTGWDEVVSMVGSVQGDCILARGHWFDRDDGG
jgi:hypothetical protein